MPYLQLDVPNSYPVEVKRGTEWTPSECASAS
jgi:hypothetical protein